MLFLLKLIMSMGCVAPIALKLYFGFAYCDVRQHLFRLRLCLNGLIVGIQSHGCICVFQRYAVSFLYLVKAKIVPRAAGVERNKPSTVYLPYRKVFICIPKGDFSQSRLTHYYFIVKKMRKA